MAWPLFPSETAGADGRVTGADFNLARNFTSTWVNAAVSASAVTLPGDGAYKLTYSGATNLDDINGTADGDKFFLIADRTGGAADLTIRHNQGNIRTPGGINIVMNSDETCVVAVHIGSIIKVVAVG